MNRSVSVNALTRNVLESGCHHREMRLVGLVARHAVDMRQKSEHDVVVVRACVEEHLVAPRRCAEGYLMLERVCDRLYCVLAQVGYHAAILVAPQFVDSDLVAVFAYTVAVLKHGAVGLLLRPGC